MPVRCIIQLQAIKTMRGWSTPDAKLYELTLQPIADKEGRYKEFFEATPSGSITLGVVNEAAAAYFLKRPMSTPYIVDITAEDELQPPTAP